jgi:hypothetical protein
VTSSTLEQPALFDLPAAPPRREAAPTAPVEETPAAPAYEQLALFEVDAR